MAQVYNVDTDVINITEKHHKVKIIFLIFHLSFAVFEMVSCILGWPQDKLKDGFELLILLPLS